MVVKILKTIASVKLKKKSGIDFEAIEKKIKAAEEGVDLTPRSNLEKKKSTDKTLKIKDKKLTLKEGQQTATKVKIKQEKIKLKDQSKQADEVLEDIKIDLLDNKIGREILSDFNINKITSEEDIKVLIQKISQKFAKEFDKQKRGVQTNKVTKQLSTLLNQNENALTSKLLTLQPGSTLNAETIFASRELLVASLNKLDDLAKKVENGNTSDLIAFRQHFALTSELQKVIKGVQTETARALQQFRIGTREVGRSNPNMDALLERDLILELGDDAATKDLATLYLDSGSPEKKLAFNQATGVFANITKFSDAIAESFINVILSNPMTHVRNTAGNWITSAIVQAERKMATMMPTFGKNDFDKMVLYEDVAKAFGKHQIATEMHVAMKKSLAQALKGNFEAADIKPIFNKGSKVELGDRINAASAANFNIENKIGASMADIVGKTITLNRIPTRFLTFADNYFKNIEYRGELYGLGFREAMKKIELGELDIKQAEDYIADFVVNPSKNAVKEAYDAAHYVTYQTKNRGDFLDNVLKTGSAIKRNSGWFSWWTNYYLPFIRTPTNIAGFTFERTPGLNFLLKSWNDDFAAGGARRQKALSKLALGSSFYGMIAPLGYFNHVSGSNPRVNKKSKRDILALENEIPKSINFDEFRIGTMGMDPLAQMMSMAADAGQLAHYIADDPDNWKSYTDFTLGMIIAFGDNLKNSTYMQGVTNFAEDWTYGKQAYNNDTDDKFWKKYFQRYAASFVPTGVEQVGKFFDDDFKKITKEFDSILLKNIVENQKAIDYDILGQPIYKIGFFNRIRKNTTTGEIKRVNPTLPKLNKYFNFNDEAGVTRLFPQQVEMTEEEESAFKLVAGRLTNDGGFPAPGGSVLRSAFKFDVVPGLQQMFKEDYYQKMPREVQEKLISATISAARGFTKNEMQKDKSISERVMTEGYDLLRKDLPNIRGMNDN